MLHKQMSGSQVQGLYFDLINNYRFCLNNGLNVYDLLGEMSCIEKWATVAKLEAQVLAIDLQIIGLTEYEAATIIAIISARMILGELSPAQYVAELNLAACLARKERECNVDCQPEQDTLDWINNRIHEINDQIDLLNKHLIDVALKISDLMAERLDLIEESKKLQQQPCDWF
jgi:hypothetical protein